MFGRLVLTFLVLVICACGGHPSVDFPEAISPDETADQDPSPTDLETVTRQEGENGGTVIFVQPNIHSKEDLMAYREQKIAEIEGILEATAEQSIETPYYPAVITMKRPVSLANLRKMLARYNPTVAAALQLATEPVLYLPKVQLVESQDALVIQSAKFVSTQGGGQFSSETLSDEKQLSKLEKQIAQKEKELNGIEDYRLIKGVTSIRGGIHRDSVLSLQEDPNVFLADIGPAEMYEDPMNLAVWADLSYQAEKYLQ